MPQTRRRPARRLELEPLEGLTLMSALAPPAAPAVRAAQVGDITTDPRAVAAILAALRGGPGNEFATLLRRQVPNLNATIRSFVSGQRTQLAVRGVAVQIPNFQPGYVGPRLDNLSITAAGAVAQRGQVLQVGAILLGPFDENNRTQLVFAIDRGTGAARPPILPERPGLLADALITLDVGPFGSPVGGTVRDLDTGTLTELDAARIQVRGSTIRAFVPLSLLPSTGARLGQYRFAAYTRNASAQGGFETVASLAADGQSIPIGTLGISPRLRPGVMTRPRRA